LINLSQKISTQSRDRLFYDQYVYCLQIFLQDLRALRKRTHKGIEQFCNNWSLLRDVNYGGSWHWPIRRSRPVTETSRDNCHTALDALNAVTIPHKLIINDDWGYIYTNNLDPFNDLISSPGVRVEGVKSAVVDRPRDTLVIKSSVHNQRTYFRNQTVTIEAKTAIGKFLDGRSEVRLSPGLQGWLWDFPEHKYLCDNYFIDHNDDGFLTMLQLVAPLKIKKTYKLLRE